MKRVLALALVALFAACDAVQQSSGVEEPTPLQVEALRDLAEQGDASAQNNLGLLYDLGTGVPQDHAEAVKWYRMAAEQGHADAQYNLSVMYNNGKGVPQDYSEAVKWLRKAADQIAEEQQLARERKPKTWWEALKW